MSVTPEQLAAYADGELDAAQASAIEAQLADDAGLQAQVAAHRALKAKLAAHFAPIADQPVPDRLRSALTDSLRPGEVVDFADAARRLRERRVWPRWTWIAGPALAASLVLALLGIGSNSGDRYAEGKLAAALDNQLVASQRPDAPVRILLSFRNNGGQFCRGFSETSRAGIACRDESGWQLRKSVRANRGLQSGEYRQAGSGEAEVLAAIQETAAGPALDADAEREAMRRKWRPIAPEK
jgi:hypothetical protein